MSRKTPLSREGEMGSGSRHHLVHRVGQHRAVIPQNVDLAIRRIIAYI